MAATTGASRGAVRRRWRAAAVVIASASIAMSATAASGAPVARVAQVAPVAPVDAVDAGAVVLVNPTKPSADITHGGAGTQFSLRLPDGAVCPGDSANDQWRVQSFIIPAADDPARINYGAIGPEPVGNGRYALFEVDTTPYVHQLTLRNAEAGHPGVIAVIPSLSFEVVAGEHIPSGNYRIGLACTYFGATRTYWDTDIIITDPPGSKADALKWRLAGLPESVNESDASSGLSLGLGLGVGVAAGGACALAVADAGRRRRGRRPITLSKEPS